MTHAEFAELQAALIDKVTKITVTKGREYANDDSDRLANFKRTARQLGISPLTVWAIFLHKHLDAIDSYVRTNRTFSEESLEGRFIDAITYLTLGWGLINDKA